MLISLVLYLFYAVLILLTLPLRLLNDVTLPSWLTAVISTANGYLATAYQVLPVFLLTLLLTWGVYLLVETGIFIYKGIRWIYQKIPGIS